VGYLASIMENLSGNTTSSTTSSTTTSTTSTSASSSSSSSSALTLVETTSGTVNTSHRKEMDCCESLENKSKENASSVTCHSAAGNTFEITEKEEGNRITVRAPVPVSVPHTAITECPICLEEPGLSNSVITTCGHIMCVDCAKLLIKVNKKCPICNTALGAS
jgi:Zinc finger, C3HC4 type (RING finger)